MIQERMIRMKRIIEYIDGEMARMNRQRTVLIDKINELETRKAEIEREIIELEAEIMEMEDGKGKLC